MSTKELTEIAKEALGLPVGQRRTLARILLDLSEDDQDFSPDVEAVWEEEISRRMQTVLAGAARSRSADEMFTDIERHFGS